MELKQLRIENFISVKKIELDLNDRGLLLIKGENKDDSSFDNNGAGKSSIIEAVVYALYGRTLRGLKGDEVVHVRAKKDCVVSLSISDDDGTEYKITRHRKHRAGKNEVWIERNGVQLNQASIKSADEFVTHLLQMDYMTFVSSILYSQASFRFTSASDAEMKSAFDTMLDLVVLELCKEEAKRRQGEEQRRLTGLVSKVEALQRDATLLGEQHTKAQEDSTQWTEQNKNAIKAAQGVCLQLETNGKQLVKDKKKLVTEIETAEAAQLVLEAELNKWWEQLNTDIPATTSAMHIAKREVDDIGKTILKIDKENQQLEARIERASASITKVNNQIQAAKDKAAAQIQELQNNVGTPCPVCSRPLKEEHMSAALQEIGDKLAEDIEELQEKLTELEEGKAEDEKSLEKQHEHMETFAADFEKAKKNHKRLKEKVDKLNKEQEETQKKCEELNHQHSEDGRKLSHLKDWDLVAIEKKIAGNEAELRMKRQTVKDLEAAINPHTATVERIAQQIESKSHEADKYTGDITKSTKLVDELEQWVGGFGNSGIKSFLLDSVTPYLNRRINHYLSKLSSDQSVEFSTQTKLKSGEMREKFALNVVNVSGGELYTANSGGERKRVDLAVNLALQDLISSRGTKKLNVAFYDEVFDALDETGCENVINLLREVSASRNSIFVISHNRTLTSHFDNSITVQKRGGYSTLVG